MSAKKTKRLANNDIEVKMYEKSFTVVGKSLFFGREVDNKDLDTITEILKSVYRLGIEHKLDEIKNVLEI